MLAPGPVPPATSRSYRVQEGLYTVVLHGEEACYQASHPQASLQDSFYKAFIYLRSVGLVYAWHPHVDDDVLSYAASLSVKMHGNIPV